MIGIINYKTSGNYRSLSRVLNTVGAKYKVVSTPKELKTCDKLILPGVGNFQNVMSYLQTSNFLGEIQNFANVGKPIMGICIGAQIMCCSSEESPGAQGLKIFEKSLSVKKLLEPDRVPNIGSKAIKIIDNDPLFSAYDGEKFYFMHSYASNVTTGVTAVAEHSRRLFAAVFRKDLIWGVQFHPELSGEPGKSVMEKFTKL